MKRIDREKIRELVLKGLKDREIAKILGCKAGTIQQIRVNELGILKRKNNGLWKKILEAWEKGIRSPSEIAYQVGATPCYVNYTLLKYGLRKPRHSQKNTYTSFFESLLDSPKTAEELQKLGFDLDSQRELYKTLRLKNYPVNQIVLQNGTVYFVKGQEESAKRKAMKIAKDTYEISFIQKF